MKVIKLTLSFAIDIYTVRPLNSSEKYPEILRRSGRGDEKVHLTLVSMIMVSESPDELSEND